MPSDITSVATALPNVTELSLDFGGDVLDDPQDHGVSNIHFVLEMAPRLATLLLQNGTTGIPLALILKIIASGTHLRRLDTTLIVNWEPSSPSAPLPAPLSRPGDLPPLQLGMIYNPWMSGPATTDSGRLEHQLWARFECWDDGAIEAISAVRSLDKVVMETWIAKRYPEGVKFAVAKMRQKGLKLEFDTPDHSFFAAWS